MALGGSLPAALVRGAGGCPVFCPALALKPCPRPGQCRAVKAQTCCCVLAGSDLMQPPSMSLVSLVVPGLIQRHGSGSVGWALRVQVLVPHPRAAAQAGHHALSDSCHPEKFRIRRRGAKPHAQQVCSSQRDALRTIDKQWLSPERAAIKRPELTAAPLIEHIAFSLQLPATCMLAETLFAFGRYLAAPAC